MLASIRSATIVLVVMVVLSVPFYVPTLAVLHLVTR